MYIHLNYLVIPAFQVPGLYVQGLVVVVKLLVAIQDLRFKSWEASESIFLDTKSAPECVLSELYVILPEEFDGRLPVPIHHAATRT